MEFLAGNRLDSLAARRLVCSIICIIMIIMHPSAFSDGVGGGRGREGGGLPRCQEGGGRRSGVAKL